MLKSIKSVYLLGISCLFFNDSFAQINLNEVSVKAAKYETKIEQTGKITQVLSDSVFVANRGKSLSQLLSEQAGIQILGNSQSPGSVKTTYMRAGGIGETLVLIDGVPVFDPSAIASDFDLNFIALENVAQIEIIRGGQSVLFGSDALAGVINIITKKSHQKPLALNMGAHLGRFKTAGLNLGVGGAKNNFNYNVSGVFENSDGFSSAALNPVLSSIPIYDNDGVKQTALQAALAYQVKNLGIKIGGSFADYKTDLDAGAFVDDADFVSSSKNWELNTGFDLNLEKAILVMNYRFGQTERRYLDDSLSVPATAFNSFSDANYHSKAHFAELYFKKILGDWGSIIIGTDFRRQLMAQDYYSVSAFGVFIDTPILENEANINNSSGYVDAKIRTSNGFGIEAGTRLNHHSIYKSNWSWSLNPYWVSGAGLKVFGTVSESFKNPSLYQLYSPYGNTELAPQEAITVEMGVNYTQENHTFQAAVFNRENTNLFFFQSLADFPYGVYQNVGKQTVRGLELESSYRVGGFSARAFYTYNDGRETTQKGFAESSFGLRRIPRHHYGWQGSYHVQNFDFNLGTQFYGKRNDSFYNSQTFENIPLEMEAYWLVNAAVAYQINKNIRVNVLGNNLLNAFYYELYGFNAEPVNFKLAINFKL